MRAIRCFTRAGLGFLAGVASAAAAAAAAAAEEEGADGKPEPIAVVELFTSQGCSSCPPADRLLGKLAEASPRVHALSFHVDYWNRLGWTDPYSSKENTRLQYRYGDRFRSRTVYTPQAIVNGRAEMVGSQADRLRESVIDALETAPRVALTLSVKPSGSDKEVLVTHAWRSTGVGDIDANEFELRLALAEKSAGNAVPRGENAGRTLRHVNVVRDFKTVPLGEGEEKGSTTLSLPPGLAPGDAVVFAYAQRKGLREIVGAARLDLAKAEN